MSLFDYQATRQDGSETAGRIEAYDSAEARRLLASQGLEVRDLTLFADASNVAAGSSLSANESEQFANHLARFGTTGLPLESGLRAAAAEVDNPRVAAALNDLADQLGQGTSLEDAINRPGCQLPGHVCGLVAAASRTGRLGAALAELVDHQRQARSLRRDALSGFGYPIFVACVATAVYSLILFGITGTFQRMFIEFELNLPYPTILLFWWRDVGIWIFLLSVVCCCAIALVIRRMIGPAAWMQLLSTMPIVGRLSYWSGLAEWTGLMSVLIHHDVPLPEALRLSGGGVRNAFVGEIVSSLAAATTRGRSFSDALSENRKVPASLVPVIRWGERTGSLPEALTTTREILIRRVRVRSLMLKTVIPPFLFIVIVSQVSSVVVALFLPLVSLIQGLS